MYKGKCSMIEFHVLILKLQNQLLYYVSQHKLNWENKITLVTMTNKKLNGNMSQLKEKVITMFDKCRCKTYKNYNIKGKNKGTYMVARCLYLLECKIIILSTI